MRFNAPKKKSLFIGLISMRIQKYFIILILMNSMSFTIFITTISLRQNRTNLSFHICSTFLPDNIIYRKFAQNSSVTLSVFHGFFNCPKSNDSKSTFNHTQIYDNESTCIPVHTSFSVKTLFEYDNISVLPKHRLKIQQTNLIPAICFYSDSFVPIHKGHLDMLEEVKTYINNLGTHELLATYISPSHSQYVAKQVKPEEMIGVGHRLTMINLAIEDLDWVMVDLFQIFQPCNIKLSLIMKAFISRVHSQLPNGTKIDIFWLLNEDSLTFNDQADRLPQSELLSMHVINRQYNETIVNVNNQWKSVQNYYKNLWNDLQILSSFSEQYYIIHAKHTSISSSNIRSCAHKFSITHEQLQLCTHLNTITTYILQHHLWKTSTDTSSDVVPVLSKISNEYIRKPTFLSYLLSASLNKSITVTSSKWKRIDRDLGTTALLSLFHNIQYSSENTESLPRSIVFKLSTRSPNGVAVANEPRFYLQFAPRISNIKVPKAYYVARHPSSPRFGYLLLEDLSIDYIKLESISSLDDTMIFSVIASLASLHAEFFKHPLFHQEAFKWLPSLSSRLTYFHDKYVTNMADYRYTKLIKLNTSDKAYAYAKELAQHLPHLFQRLSDEHYTLSHGDFLVKNAFRSRNEPHHLLVIDWQTCSRANGLIDLVFFLRYTSRNQGRLLEPKALELYHQVLVKYGVSQYSISQIRNDYYSLALPFMFINYFIWRFPGEDRFNEMVMMLEDTVAYGNNP